MADEPLYIPTPWDREMYDDGPDTEIREGDFDDCLLDELSIVDPEHLEQLRRDIPDDPASALIIPKQPEARRIQRVGVTTRIEGLWADEREIALMYRRRGGSYGIKHFVMTRETCVMLANRLLEIAGVEVSE